MATLRISRTSREIGEVQGCFSRFKISYKKFLRALERENGVD